jgi:hypothetical protein
MSDTVSTPNAPYNIGVLEWVGVLIYFGDLLYLFVTENMKGFTWVVIVAGVVAIADSFVKTRTSPQVTVSLLGSSATPKPKFIYGAFFWVGFALMLAAFIFLQHIRMVALLMMSGLCLLIFNRYKNATSS